MAGPALTGDGSCDEYIRIQFVQDDQSIALGVRRLAQAWRSHEGQRPPDHGEAANAPAPTVAPV